MHCSATHTLEFGTYPSLGRKIGRQDGENRGFCWGFRAHVEQSRYGFEPILTGTPAFSVSGSYVDHKNFHISHNVQENEPEELK